MVTIGESLLTPGGMRQKDHAGGPPTLQGRSRVPESGGDALTRAVPIASRQIAARDNVNARPARDSRTPARRSPLARFLLICQGLEQTRHARARPAGGSR